MVGEDALIQELSEDVSIQHTTGWFASSRHLFKGYDFVLFMLAIGVYPFLLSLSCLVSRVWCLVLFVRSLAHSSSL